MMVSSSIQLALILVAVLGMAQVQAFLPSSRKAKPFLAPLGSTKEENELEQKEPGLRQSMPPPKLSKVSPNVNVNIKIAPLGTNPKFGASDPLKEFPSYDMKERLHKIRSPRNNKKPKVDFPANAFEEQGPEDLLPELNVVSCPPLLFGNGQFFATDELIQVTHENADVGNPLESYRTLADKIPLENDMFVSCGSASCSQGGWPSKEPTPTTQIFYTLDGFGCLTDMDGNRHYFGPGDTVLVPKNWAGRWDVAEHLHKIWFTLDGKEAATEMEIAKVTEEENDTEDDSSIVRAKVIHYHELVKWSVQHTSETEDAIVNNEDPHKSETTFVTVEDFGLGLSCFTCFSPSSVDATETVVSSVPFSVQPRKFVDCFHILEGTLVLTPVGGGQKTSLEPSFEFSSGDTIVLPKGWAGYCEIKEAVKALRVRA